MFFFMGNLDVLLMDLMMILMGFIMYNMMCSNFFFNMLNSFGMLKMNSKDFYECGFKPFNLMPNKSTLQFISMCLLFMIMDVELLFLFPYTTKMNGYGLFDFSLMFFFFLIFFFNMLYDYTNHCLYWQY